MATRGWNDVTADQIQQRSGGGKTKARSPKVPRPVSHLEEALARYIQMAGLPPPKRQWQFALPRKWSVDFGWPERGVILEVEGGTFKNGRHSRGKGMRNDAEKYNTATLLGHRVFRVTVDMIEDGTAYELIHRIFRAAA